MTFKPVIKEIVASDRNEENGLHQFVVTLTNQAKCRLFFSKNPDWKIIGVNRLLNMPCPICRKDYYCNCMSNYASDFEQQIIEQNPL
ncbi:hypothetical protein ACFOQM_18440 [Paenibacillus sp. GCM10012307]|uniref:Uncharacterized protein n=1 Tax=Paenibacillus roseus TaxID=2798579 RepID=A0A934J9P4_9BACL|nr:hypothetical protein [Paenibacillus roseus]MBJ6363201.1 hypothetical protein [Paenibacillus roseus]